MQEPNSDIADSSARPEQASMAREAQRPVATLYVTMAKHDMGQSLAPNTPFKMAQAHARATADALPLGEYPLYIAAPEPQQSEFQAAAKLYGNMLADFQAATGCMTAAEFLQLRASPSDERDLIEELETAAILYGESDPDTDREAECLDRMLQARAALRALPAQAAVRLWALLDDIDTLDDACRSDDAAFRKSARAVQRKRFDVISGEQWDALRAAMQASSTADTEGTGRIELNGSPA